ncbi:MAG TPA: hypothetical protein PLD51_00550 [Pontiellaceae bacterium]|nr:hypothetical protein [Pontiellaceae bacterium]HPR82322.1 hypothetical protein [Pontiellaceae bacterium]
MCKKLVLLTVVLLASLTTVQAAWKSNITMLVVPEEKIPLQIAQDLSRRYPVLLVSYRLARGEAKLHAWNGDTWIPVSAEDYANGTFFANRPSHAIIVENERVHVPLALTPNSTWCTTASRLTTTDPRILLHLFGRYFNFPFRYWDQFAQRYSYTIEEINPTLENVYWWNRYSRTKDKNSARLALAADMNKWTPIALLPPPRIEPVTLEKEPVIPEVEKPATEPVDGAVDITVSAPEPKVEKKPDTKPVIKPEMPASKPFPSLKPEPVIKPAAAAEKAPAGEPEPVIESVPAIEPAPAPLVEAPATAPAAEIEKTVNAEVPAPAPLVTEVDPFAADEVPAAEIVVPQPPKKPWWKF